MTQAQKIIKYFAISLAVFLIVLIFYTIFGIISSIFGFSLSKETNEVKVQTINSNINNLDIDLSSSKLTFKIDNEFKIETNKEDFYIKEKNNELEIEEKNNWFFKNSNSEVIIYLPQDKTFQEVKIDAGSGSVNIENLHTNKLDLDLGAGTINVDKLTVINNADIDTGAGNVDIRSGEINNLDLDMGVGKTTISTKLVGNSEIDAGVGELNINLNDRLDNYNFIINKGIGEIKINNEAIPNNYRSGNGVNRLDIEGGIGSININTIN